MMLLPGRRILPLFFTLSFGAGFVHAATVPIQGYSPQEKRSLQVRVRIAEEVATFRVRGFDLHFMEYGAGPSTFPVARADRATEWSFRCTGGKLHVTGGGSKKPTVVKGPLSVESPAGFFQFNGRPYREALHIYANRSSCEVVNVVDLEKYLDGLVNSEFNSRWSSEAIAAQVIAARTYALYGVREARKNPKRRYDLESTIKDQVYDGTAKEDYRASREVARTRGLVLTVRSEPLKAFYHSTCGGMTGLPQTVWGQAHRGFNRIVKCDYCTGSPKFQWNVEVSEREIRDALLASTDRKGWPRDAARFLSLGKLDRFTVARSDGHGRALDLRVVWRLGAETRVLPTSAAALRSKLGTTRLLSTWFDVSEAPAVRAPAGAKAPARRFVLSGRGYGHGVGLCQYGAKGMGEQGFKATQILKHYYPGATLSKLW